jgi:hypothetical protein
MESNNCQLPCLQLLSEGHAEVPPLSLGRRLKLIIRRRLSPRQERAFKKHSNDMIAWIRDLTRNSKRPSALATRPTSGAGLKSGDSVRVRSEEEIQATLNYWRQLKGCTFMPEMQPFCGTVQRVLKPMERFVDERDLRAKKCTGIILLEGVMCQGTSGFGQCDRSCFFFWREEWLEKIE